MSKKDTLSLLDAIHQRRSVRSYTTRQLDHATVLSLLEAAVQAPTAMHEEAWSFVVVQDAERLQRLSDRAKTLLAEEAQHAPSHGGLAIDAFTRPEFNVFYDAGTLIVICAKPANPLVVADCWLAAENLMLAACAQGLGSCVIGLAIAALNAPDIKAELGIPTEVTAIAPIIIGVPRGETPAVSRKQPEILAWK